MKLRVIGPDPPDSRRGNSVAVRHWAAVFRDLGHKVEVGADWFGHECDLLVALHARRSAEAIARFRKWRPGAPLVVVFSGTDIYGRGELFGDEEWEAVLGSMEAANALVAVQERAVDQVPVRLKDRYRTIFLGAPDAGRRLPPNPSTFDIVLLTHMRPLKDPFRTPLAARRLPSESRVRVLHLGGAWDEEMAVRAAREERANHRYSWLGEVSRHEALQVLGTARLLVVSSFYEGGPNAITEAIAAGVPVLATRIPGIVGVLGEDYAGYFPPGDTETLADLIARAEGDAGFLGTLGAQLRELEPRVDPDRERAAWSELLDEITRA